MKRDQLSSWMIFDVNTITMFILLNFKGRYFDIVFYDYLKRRNFIKSEINKVNSCNIFDEKMLIYKYLILILIFACITFLHGETIKTLKGDNNGDPTIRVGTLKGISQYT